jgi:hypothetical protein
MSKLRTFRIDGYRLDKRETDFLAKIEDDNSQLMGTFDMSGEGIFYYRPGSQIMTEKENQNSRESYDGFISFENLKEIFEKLKASGWNRDKHVIEVRKDDEAVVLRVVDNE